MAITEETVKYVADLARIKLTPKELEKLSQQLQDILGFIDKLNKADVKNIAPMSQILPVNPPLEIPGPKSGDERRFIQRGRDLRSSGRWGSTNVLRDDQPSTSLPSDKALENAPQREGNLFGVPKVIE